MAEAAGAESAAVGWYACYTRPRAEKKVHALLRERGIESYLPLVACVHRWRDRKRTVLVPLFASYVFARGEALGRILETLGVRDVVRFDGRPAVVPDRELSNIQRFVEALAGTARPVATGRAIATVPFREGERVLITAGPFAGVEGVLLRGGRHRRVIVGLAAVGAGFEVHVPAGSVAAVECE